MDRREFLKNLALSAGGVYVSTKTIFLPPSGGWPTFGISVADYPHVFLAQNRMSMIARIRLDSLAQVNDIYQ